MTLVLADGAEQCAKVELDADLLPIPMQDVANAITVQSINVTPQCLFKRLL